MTDPGLNLIVMLTFTLTLTCKPYTTSVKPDRLSGSEIVALWLVSNYWVIEACVCYEKQSAIMIRSGDDQLTESPTSLPSQKTVKET